MGLDVYAKGMPRYSISYIRYGGLRAAIVRKVYGERCYNIFTTSPWDEIKMTHEEKQANADYWNSVCNDDLDLFLLHSDCDGKFTPKECKAILKAIEPIDVDFDGLDFDRKPCNLLDHWKEMFRHCAKRRVNMYFY